jgi:hypothetical protein
MYKFGYFFLFLFTKGKHSMALIGSLGGGEELAYLSADALAGFGICMGVKIASGYIV